MTLIESKIKLFHNHKMKLCFIHLKRTIKKWKCLEVIRPEKIWNNCQLCFIFLVIFFLKFDASSMCSKWGPIRSQKTSLTKIVFLFAKWFFVWSESHIQRRISRAFPYIILLFAERNFYNYRIDKKYIFSLLFYNRMNWCNLQT